MILTPNERYTTERGMPRFFSRVRQRWEGGGGRRWDPDDGGVRVYRRLSTPFVVYVFVSKSFQLALFYLTSVV